MKALFAGSIAVLSLWSIGMVMTSRDPVPAGKRELVWVSDDTPIRRAQVELFNRLNPDLHLKLDPGNRDSNKVIVQSLGGVGPDVFDVAGTDLAIFVNSGIALDVTDKLKEKGIDPEKQFWPASRPLYQYNGRNYGVPANLDTIALLYNKEIFEKEGVEPPSQNATWEEIIDKAKKLMKKGPDGEVERYGLLFWFDTRDFLAMEGARLFSDDGSRITVDTPEAKRALDRMRSLVYDHEISPSPTAANAMSGRGGWGAGNEGRFVAGRSAMVIGPRYFTAHFRRAGGMRVGVAPLPLGPGGSTRVRGRTVAVNSRSKNLDGALRFLAFLASPEYNRLNNDLADGVGAVVAHTYEPSFIFNPDFPEEKSNAAWRESMLSAKPDQTSPFVTNNQMDEAMFLHMDLMTTGKKTPDQALADIQKAAEKKLSENLRENEELAARHKKALSEAVR